ncbi:hypothetical protein ACFL1T_00645, partial [Chlamydiota bacterium]
MRTFNTVLLHKWISLVFIFLGIVLIVVFAFIPRDYSVCLVEEGGPIENYTLLLLFIAILLCLWRYVRNNTGRLFWSELGLLFLGMGLREFDIHRRVQSFNYLRGDFYVNSS